MVGHGADDKKHKQHFAYRTSGKKTTCGTYAYIGSSKMDLTEIALYFLLYLITHL
jgi:hypothetical protein